MSDYSHLSRRQFLLAGAAGATSLVLPNASQASWSDIGNGIDIDYVMRLQPIRFYCRFGV